MDVVKELAGGNRKAVRLWLLHAEPRYLWHAVVALAELGEVEMFRVANKRFVESSIKDSLDYGLATALRTELEKREVSFIPEIAYELFARMVDIGLRISVKVATPAHISITYAKNGVDYTVVQAPPNAADLTPWRFVAYLRAVTNPLTTTTEDQDWAGKIIALLIQEIEKLPTFARAWENDLMHPHYLDTWEGVRRWYGRR